MNKNHKIASEQDVAQPVKPGQKQALGALKSAPQQSNRPENPGAARVDVKGSDEKLGDQSAPPTQTSPQKAGAKSQSGLVKQGGKQGTRQGGKQAGAPQRNLAGKGAGKGGGQAAGKGGGLARKKVADGAPVKSPAAAPKNTPPIKQPAQQPATQPLKQPGAQPAGARPGAGPNPAAAAQAQSPGKPPQAARPAPPPPAAVVEVRPKAAQASMKRRHWGLLISFFLFVVTPLAVASWYLYFVSVDQYASTVGFTVRQEESGSATDLLGGLAQFTGAGVSGDADVLYEFIQSQEMVENVDAALDLVGHYSAYWETDPVFSIWPDADIEDLLWFWQRILRVSYDQGTGLVNLQVRAFDPQMAQAIGNEIVRISQARVNALNEAARADLMRYAQEDLDESLDRLKAAREALTQFRVRTRIVDPEADIQGRMGVFNNLQQQLAQALVEYDILRTRAAPNDPRLVQELQRIEVIQERIRQERQTFAAEKVVGGEADYPTLLAEFESLTVDREFAEETYRLALAAMDLARANATRQSRYLATYIRPTLAQSAEYPQREVILALATLFLLMAWAILALIFYSLRDRR